MDIEIITTAEPLAGEPKELPRGEVRIGRPSYVEGLEGSELAILVHPDTDPEDLEVAARLIDAKRQIVNWRLAAHSPLGE